MSSSELCLRLGVAALELALLYGIVHGGVKLGWLRSPRLVSWLWLVVLAKPALTLAGGIALPLVHLETGAAPETIRIEVTEEVGITNVEETAIAIPREATAPNARDIACRWTGLVWMAGVLGIVLQTLLRHVARLRLVRRSLPATGRVHRIRGEVLRELGLTRSPRIRLTTELASPALSGVLSPTVLIPTWMAEEGHDTALRWSLKHELRHWIHRDPLRACLRRLGETLFFFHPLTRSASRRWEEATEMACDQAVVRNAAEARDYAQELYNIVARSRELPRLSPVGLSVARSSLGRRVARLLRTGSRARKGRHAAPGLAFALILLVTGVGFSSPAPFEALELEIEDEIAHRPAPPASAAARLHIDLVTPSSETDLVATGPYRLDPGSPEFITLLPGGRMELRELDRTSGVERTATILRRDDGTQSLEFRLDGVIAPVTEECRRWIDGLLDACRRDALRAQSRSTE